MDYKDFVKKLHATVVKENRGAVKLSSKAKRAERRVNRFNSARVKERNIRQDRIVREMRREMDDNKRRLQLSAIVDDDIE